MPKIADKYFEIDPWRVVERGFDPSRSRVSESVFSLGNEYMGVRGYFEEGYSGDSLKGSYFNGIYEIPREETRTAYKGIVKRSHFMVNSVDWLHTRVFLDGEVLDAAKSHISDFVRCLDMRTGVLCRELVWRTGTGKSVRIAFERFLSMANPRLGEQRITFTPLNFNGLIEVVSGLDFSPVHENEGHNFWHCPQKGVEKGIAGILGKTVNTGQQVFSGFKLRSSPKAGLELLEGDKFIGYKLSLEGKEGMSSFLEKAVVNDGVKDPEASEQRVWTRGLELAEELCGQSFQEASREHGSYWEKVWNTLDISIEGDDENQQGIRYCIFQLHQTYHGEDPGSNIGAKGLTGEAYNGHAFWDTETCCLPFYLFNNPKAARNLLEYRYRTLPLALDRAGELDCRGACYPIATLNGKEACTLWQHASLQPQPSTAVAYGIWHYVKLTGDKEFLFDMGLEMLIQISRFMASRGQWGSRTGEFGYFCVMGPDEFQMMVNNNCYTNFMAKKTFEYTLEVLEEMKALVPEKLEEVLERVGFTETEACDWRRMGEKMRIPLDKARGIYEQHDGYFDLPHIDIDSIPVEEFPLYHHWSYDRIYRNDMIKQPDVLMFLFLYNRQFSPEAKRANYEFYEPRCIHESSLSPSIHSILAAELGKDGEAFDFFRFATRMDLDNYNRNTREGLHTTSIAAAWMNIVYGFGGLRSDGDMLELNPSLPGSWASYGFKIIYGGEVLSVKVLKDGAVLSTTAPGGLTVRVYGKECCIGTEEVRLERPSAPAVNEGE